MANLATDADSGPILEAAETNTSQCPLPGEEEHQESEASLSGTKYTASTHLTGSIQTSSENGVASGIEDLNTPAQGESLWYRRRMRSVRSVGFSREDSAAWSLFTRDFESPAPSEPDDGNKKSYWDLRKLDTFTMWSLEVFALIISMVSFAGIAVLLAKYDGKPPPKLASQISINAIIAIFSTILRAGLLFVVSEVMGQLKWQWMETPRPIRDIEHFIDAGMGVGGSLKFIFFPSKPILAIIGALIVIASSAIGPFSQQTSAMYPCDEPGSISSAKIKFSHIMNEKRTPEMRSIAIKGLLYGASDGMVTTSRVFQCATGNCKFGIHESVALCNTCTGRITDWGALGRAGRTGHYSPDDPGLTVDLPSSTSGADTWDALRIKTFFKPMPKPKDFNQQIKPKIIDSLLGENMTISSIMLTTNGYDNVTRSPGTGDPDNSLKGRLGILTVNCTMFPCIRNYSAKVVNGRLQQHVVSQRALPLVSRLRHPGGNPLSEYYGDFIEFTDPCYYNKTWWDSSSVRNASRYLPRLDDDWLSWRLNDKMTTVPTNCSRMIGSETYASIQTFVDSSIKASCNISGNADVLEKLLKTVNCGDKWWIDSLFQGGAASVETVSNAFDGMAIAISNIIRTEGKDSSRKLDAHFAGSVSKGTVCVKAFWSWLFYPGTLLVLTTALFMTTYITSITSRRKRPVWKSSVLPLIFYDIKWASDRFETLDDTDAGHQNVALLQLFELEQEADTTVVRFDNDADFPAFVEEQGKGKT